MRDKISISTQQSMAATLAAWHDKVDLSVRSIEKQMAYMRLNMSLSENTSSAQDGGKVAVAESVGRNWYLSQHDCD